MHGAGRLATLVVRRHPEGGVRRVVGEVNRRLLVPLLFAFTRKNMSAVPWCDREPEEDAEHEF